MKSYSEMCRCGTFEERLKYFITASGGKVSRARITIHHINPLTKEDILEHREALFDPENVISVSDATHKTIHYGTGDRPKMPDGKRTAGDTCPWRK